MRRSVVFEEDDLAAQEEYFRTSASPAARIAEAKGPKRDVISLDREKLRGQVAEKPRVIAEIIERNPSEIFQPPASTIGGFPVSWMN